MRNNYTLFDLIMYLKISEKLIFDSKRIFEKKKDGDKRKGCHSIITGTPYQGYQAGTGVLVPVPAVK